MDKAFLGIKDDNRILLLNSIKPFVSEKRQKGIDDCVRIMKMITFVDKIKGKAGL